MLDIDRDSGARHPDYDLPDEVVASSPEQLKALGDPLRVHILDLVLERAMSVTDLAGMLGRAKGTVAHHVDVLVDAGLLAVVRTRQVRAMTERFYGRTGRTISIFDASKRNQLPFIEEALAEADLEALDRIEASLFTLRRARVPLAVAEEFAARLLALTVEFTTLPRGGDTDFAVLAGVFPTKRRVHVLPEEAPE